MKEIINNKEDKLKLKLTNTNKSEIYGKEKNIWIGVSISLKEYYDNDAQKYLKFAAKNSKDKAFVVIADDIAAINNRVLEKGYLKNYPFEAARAIGDVWEEKYLKNIEILNLEDKVKILKWRDVWNDKTQKQYEILKEAYENDLYIRQGIILPMIYYLNCRGRNVNRKRLDALCEYVLRELPFLLNGIEYNGIEAKCMFYPSYNMKQNLTDLSFNIQKNEKYANLREELGIKGDLAIIDTQIGESLM
ncbi:MAG: hypothetical protein KC589_02080 [Nanoarchaeota archaeon]|nr:hypothetical protein [Nanoarchaeota archaeon]